MSMWEIEDLVECSIIAVCDSPRRGEMDLRSVIDALYRYQDTFDTSYTHFRVMERLLACGAVYRVKVGDHPDYDRCKDALDALEGFVPVYRDPCREWAKDNRFEAYFCDTYDFPRQEGEPEGAETHRLYVEAGSALWQRMVDAGRLTGPAAAPVTPMSVNEAVLVVCQELERQGATTLLREWLTYMPPYYLTMDEVPLSQWRADPATIALRDLLQRAVSFSIRSDGEIEDGRGLPPGDVILNSFRESWMAENDPWQAFSAWWFEALAKAYRAWHAAAAP